MINPEFLLVLATCTAMTIGFVQAIKKTLKPGKGGVIAISFIVAVAVCLMNEMRAPSFEWVEFILLTLATFIQANGWYLFTAQMAQKVGR